MSAATLKILVSVDLARGSARLIDLGAKLGRKCGAELHLLHVADPLADPTTLAGELGHDWLELARLAETSASGTAVRVERHVAAAGSTPAQIHAAARRIGADLVVLAAASLGSDPLDPVAREVLAATDRPVLLLVPGLAVGAGFRRIVCAVDLSERSYAAMRSAARLARLLDLELALLHVVERAPGASTFEAERTLGEWARQATLDAGRAVSATVVAGRPADEILEHLRRREADLVVMALRAPERLAEGPLGGVAIEVLRRSPCPVLAIGDPGPRGG